MTNARQSSDCTGLSIGGSNNPQTRSLTSYYFGGAYEVTGANTKKYYAFAGSMIAMRDAKGLQYFLTDHLGSVDAVRDSSGTLTSQQRYLPFGSLRTDVGSIARTDYGYTGQRNLDTNIGLMDYKARFYDSYITQFSQPDTLIPQLYNPQALNRYAYVLGNPVRNNDPSGHVPLVTPLKCDLDCWRAHHKKDEETKPRQPIVGGENKGFTCGMRGTYSPHCPNWHFYIQTDTVCDFEFHCTAEEMKAYFLLFAYPGQNPANGIAANQGNYTVGYPFTHLPMQLGWGNIVTFLDPSGFASRNVTQPGHILDDGSIVRHLYQNSYGDWVVTTYGYGNNVQLGGVSSGSTWNTAWLNQTLGPLIFENVDREMRNFIINDQENGVVHGG